MPWMTSLWLSPLTSLPQTLLAFLTQVPTTTCSLSPCRLWTLLRFLRRPLLLRYQREVLVEWMEGRAVLLLLSLPSLLCLLSRLVRPWLRPRPRRRLCADWNFLALPSSRTFALWTSCQAWLFLTTSCHFVFHSSVCPRSFGTTGTR